MTTRPEPDIEPDDQFEPEPELEREPRYGPESVDCAEECGVPAGKPCYGLAAGTYHRTRVVAANKHRARDLTRRLVGLTEQLSNRLRPGTVSTIIYQAQSGRIDVAFSTLLFHLRNENIPVMPEDHDEIETLNDVIRGGL